MILKVGAAVFFPEPDLPAEVADLGLAFCGGGLVGCAFFLFKAYSRQSGNESKCEEERSMELGLFNILIMISKIAKLCPAQPLWTPKVGLGASCRKRGRALGNAL